MPMGPPRRSSSLGPVLEADSHGKSHILGKANMQNAGMPWVGDGSLLVQPESKKDHARRRALQNEYENADQGFDWGPAPAAPIAVGAYRGRSEVLKREARGSDQCLELHPGAQLGTCVTGVARGRVNVLLREHAGEESADAPKATQVDANGVPNFGRKQAISRDAHLFNTKVKAAN